MKKIGFQVLLIILCLSIVLLHAIDDFDDLFADEAFFRVEQELTLVSIGTRGAARSTFYFTVPIEVITAEQMAKTGLTELNDVLLRFIPSFGSTRNSVCDGTDHQRPATMRGLGPDQLLVLINGKRRHPGALVHVNGSIGRGSMSVDINSIPINAIKHIEILRDGAAAQYGSDAIAGILNIVLKDDVDGEFTTTFAQTSEGDGGILKTNFNFGFNLLDDGFFMVNAEFFDRDYTNRIGPDNRRAGAGNFYKGHNTEIGSPLNSSSKHEEKNMRHGDPATRSFSIFMNSSVPVSDKTSIYSYGGFIYKHGEAGGFYRPAYNLAQNDTNFYPNGFLPLIAPEIEDKSIVLGTKTYLNDWSLDMSTAFGINTFEFNVNNSLNRHLGLESPTSFYNGRLSFIQNTSNFDLFREFDVDFLDNPLSVGIGAELRFENFIQEAGDANSYFIQSDTNLITYLRNDTSYYGAHDTPIVLIGAAQVFPGFRPENESDEKRSSKALYLDLENALTDKLLVGIATRYENFSDFGTNFDGKLAFRYLFTDNLVFRGSTSTGFRAPSLGQSYFTSTSTQFVGGVPFQTAVLSVEHPLAQALGATPLEPEKSTHLAAGIAYNNFNNLDISLDFFSVEIEDRIIYSGSFRRGNYPDAFANYPNYSAAQFWTNAVNTKTHGLDLVANYTIHLQNQARLVLSTAFNYNKTEVDSVKTIGDLTEAHLLPDVERNLIERGQPREIFHLTLNYITNNWDIFMKNIHTGKFIGRREQEEHGNQMMTDLNVSYKLTDNFRILVGAHNIFDSYPDENPLRAEGMRYEANSPLGFNGAYYHTTMTYKF